MNRMVHPLHLIKWEHIPLWHQNGYSVLTLSVPGNWPGASIPRMAISLTSVLLSRMASTHIWHGKGATLSPWQNGSALTSDLLVRMAMDLSAHISHGRNQSPHHDRMAQPLHLTMEGTNPLTMSEWLWVSSLSLGGSLDLENTKSLFEVLKLQPSQWLRQYISYLFLRCNIQELHYSSLHHIPDIVVLDLDMLWLVMEHWILWQLHTTLIVTMYTSSIQLEIKYIRQ